MIPRYYDGTADIKGNGVGALRDCISCTITEERNGSYELEMVYPVGGQHYDALALRGLIKAQPNPYAEEQLFRIYQISRPINGQVTVNAAHISYDLSGIPVAPYTASTAAQALDRIKSQATVDCPYEFWTDLTTTANFAANVPSSLRSLLGGIDGSILDVYGGEYEWDNYTVKLHSERGTDRGVSIRYGKNLTDITHEENCESVYTGVYPYWVDSDGNVKQISTSPIVDVPDSQYSFARILLLDISREYTDQPTDEQLKQYALNYIKANKIGVPKVSLKLSYAQLEQTEEYKGKALLERVGLCDTVHVTFERLGVDATAKVIKTTYNVLLDRYDSVELGTPRSNLASTIVGIEKSTKTEVDKTKSALQQAVDQATKLITGNLGGYVVLHSSAGNDTPDELLVMDQPDINTATKVWRWNLSGWGYSSTGYAGPYRLAATMDGAINADFLTTGTLNAEIIRAGILKSQTGDAFYLDLVSGELRINAKSIEINSENIYDGKTVDSKISESANQIKSEMTQITKIPGGNNIIVGTDDWNNATLDAGGNDLSKKGSYTIDGESVRVTNKAQNTRFHFGADKTLVIAKGMTYCASVLYKLNSGTDSLFLQFETKSSSGTNYYGSAFKSAQKDIEMDNGWKLRWAAFTATADGYADGLFVSTADDFATVTNDLTIMHPMVQMGNAPTAWTASTGDYLTATETKTEIKQTVNEIKLTASTSGTSSTIKLTAGGTEITSAQINLSGVVTFSDLSTWNQDKTIINGGNITTGQLHNLNYTTVYDLDNAWIRMGTEAGERVYLDNRHIAWYATINTGSIGLTGVLYSEAGSSYIGACSKYARYGWVNGLNPTSYVGMQITYNRSDDSDADFNTTRVGVSGKLNVHNLDVWGSKSRVVPTSFGALKMAAFETPLPTFADWGRGECGPDGWCLIALDPRYAETIAQYGQPAWLLTDCDGTGHLWAENCGQYAIVHGAPRQQFVWLCMAAQRGYEGSYADRSDSSYPAGEPAGVDLAASTAARAQEASTTAADDLLAMDTGADETADILLDESEELA